MNNAIPSDIWETKRILITKLYKDEEWPLKHVIKLIRTSEFCPSETQLRSRLKKWHITKPSRKKYGSHKTRSEKRTSPEGSQSSPFLSCSSGDMKQKLPIVHLEPFQYDRNSRKHDSIPPEKEERSIPKLSSAEQHMLETQSGQYLTSLDTSVRQFPCTPGTVQDFLDRILLTSTPPKPSSHCTHECTENTALSEDKAIDSIFQWQTDSINANMDNLNSSGVKDQTDHDMEMASVAVMVRIHFNIQLSSRGAWVEFYRAKTQITCFTPRKLLLDPHVLRKRKGLESVVKGRQI
ncbi:hypothetical protein BGW36DRAFT_428395 [Talaromyces proteolyticus]|uniref:Clr5 domain-containing protein n=1 Tax=Talaromyces proteolyticus TaxID=1131652 RepID=A0AAD4KPL9_9EURO|nr:uncharacterized protein BGW36DRAFT_428395 [Talaromyces proteolyticus]KAH8696376.1 hypothetical protein BGW36DRAFT_428395 [Talaromyces proteolyticus]